MEKLEKDQEVCKVFYSEELDFFGGWDEFFQEWEENYKQKNNRPTYVYATYKIDMSVDANEVVEIATDDLYEDAIFDVDDKSIEELQAYLDKWCKKCGVKDTYCVDLSYKIEIPWGLYDALKKE